MSPASAGRTLTTGPTGKSTMALKGHRAPEACVVPGLSPQRGWEWGGPLWRASRVHLSPPEPKARSSQVSCEKGRKGERKEEKGRGMGRRNRERNEDETRKRRREK